MISSLRHGWNKGQFKCFPNNNQCKRITKSLGGGGRTYKAINVRWEMCHLPSQNKGCVEQNPHAWGGHALSEEPRSCFTGASPLEPQSCWGLPAVQQPVCVFFMGYCVWERCLVKEKGLILPGRCNCPESLFCRDIFCSLALIFFSSKWLTVLGRSAPLRY